MRVLLLEDDDVLGEAVHDHVSALGSSLDWMKRLGDARECAANVQYELILLDLNLPDGRGLDFLRDLRRTGSSVPVIILTAQDQIASRIEGLDSGADDYLIKPFDLNELSARIAAVTRRYAGKPSPILKLEGANVEIDLARRSVRVDETLVELTSREWAVLERIARRPDTLVSQAEIEDSLFQFGAEIESNAVEVYISRLRKKIGREGIRTVRGVGYKAVSGR